MVIFPLAPDQTIAQMWSNGVWGGGGISQTASVSCIVCHGERQGHICERHPSSFGCIDDWVLLHIVCWVHCRFPRQKARWLCFHVAGANVCGTDGHPQRTDTCQITRCYYQCIVCCLSSCDVLLCLWLWFHVLIVTALNWHFSVPLCR